MTSALRRRSARYSLEKSWVSWGKARRDRGPVVIRMGIRGTGQKPNYRLEDTAGDAFLAIDGANHQPWPEDAKFGEPGNWSTVTMSYEDVESVIASVTGYKAGGTSRA